jgi:RHS repeat-associated protein
VGRVSTYTYDGLGRLTNEAESGATDATTYAYTYDSRSNRATLTASGAQSYTTAYNYDINDRLLQTTKTMGQTKEIVNYQYDANGNTLSALTETLTTGSGTPSLSLGSDGGYELYTYNGFNQLVSTIQDSVETTYVYKPDGLRYNKATNGTTTTHIWDGVNIAAELTGSTVTTYVRGINLITKGGGSQYYSFNAHGDVVQLTNSSGTVTKNYRYDAFGVEVDPQGTDTNPWRYCGEYWDKETGTVYLRARYYDPATSRMLSEDPMRAELNWYTYCGNNPVTYWDPLGLERIAISGGAYAAPDSVHADGFKYNFIETALRQIMDWLNLDGDEAVMWIIADAGWSAKEKKEFQGWADYRGFGIKFVDNKQQVFDYINNKDGNGRSKDPVTAFSVFSHGFASNDGVVSLGYNYTRNYNKNLDICKSDIFDMIETSSFRSPTSKFYSCNTGTSGNGSFAQAWVNKFGGVTTAFVGQSYYGNINVVGPFFEKLAKKIDRIVFGYTPSGSFDYPVAGDNASSQIFHRTIPMAGGRRAARRW